MRWALSFLFCVILVIPAYGEVPVRASKQLKIAFNNPGFADRGFWKDVSDTMQAAAHHFGADLHIWYGDRTPNKIRENAAEIFDSSIDFDYIIIVNEYQKLSGFLRKAEQRRIPTLFLLNSITDQQKQFIGRPGQIFKYWLGSITPDNDKAGYEMAASLLDFAHARNWQAPYSVLTLGGDNRTPASLERNGGLGRFLNEKMDQYFTKSQEVRCSTFNVGASPRGCPFGLLGRRSGQARGPAPTKSGLPNMGFYRFW